MAVSGHTSKPRSVLWQLGVFGAFLAVLVGVPAVYGASRLFTDGPSVRVLRSGDGLKQIEELADWDSLDQSFMLEAGTVGTELRLGSDADAVVAYLGERGLLSDDGVRNGILDGFWRDALIEQVLLNAGDASLDVLRRHGITVCDSPFHVKIWPDAGFSAAVRTIAPGHATSHPDTVIGPFVTADGIRQLNADMAACD